MALIRNDLFIIFLFPGKRTNHCGMSEDILYQKFILRTQFHGVQRSYCQKKNNNSATAVRLKCLKFLAHHVCSSKTYIIFNESQYLLNLQGDPTELK